MAETKSTSSHPSPFRDIINRSPDRVDSGSNGRADKDDGKAKNEKKLREKSDDEAEKASEGESEKTVKKELERYGEELVSVKTIHHKEGEWEDQDHPQWGLLRKMAKGEVAHVLKLRKDFRDIVVPFLQLAKMNNLKMCQQTSSFVTVKKGGAGSCHCLIRIWTGYQPQTTVYQLRKSSKKVERAKLILVEGEESAFHSFFFSLLTTLEEQNLVKVEPEERLSMLFDREKGETAQCQKIASTLTKRLSKGRTVPLQDIQSVVTRLRNQSMRLKAMVRITPGLTNVASSQRQIEDTCFRNSEIIPLFEKLYEEQFSAYLRKRQLLLRKFPISELFRQLQIGEHFTRFKRVRSLKEIDLQEKIPYLPAVKELKRLSGLQSIRASLDATIEFQKQIRLCYGAYFKDCLRVGDMDDFLPVTIFCVLAVECDSNLLALVRWLLTELGPTDDREWQKKTLTDIEASLQYIAREWVIDS